MTPTAAQTAKERTKDEGRAPAKDSAALKCRTSVTPTLNHRSSQRQDTTFKMYAPNLADLRKYPEGTVVEMANGQKAVSLGPGRPRFPEPSFVWMQWLDNERAIN